jgi:hypothetical protein
MTDKALIDRITSLENEVKSLKMGSTGTSDNTKAKKEKKEKKPRAQTEYNKFVSNYINEQKEKLGAEFNHKAAFKSAAEKWGEQKKAKEAENGN